MIELMMQSLGVTTDDVEGLKKFVKVINELPPDIQFIKQQGESTMEEIEKLKSELSATKAELVELKLSVVKLIDTLNEPVAVVVKSESDK